MSFDGPIKVKLIGSGKEHDPFRVGLPSFIVDKKRDNDGNIIYDKDGNAEDTVDYVNKVCMVLVPSDEVTIVKDKKVLDQERIRIKYAKNWSQFNKEDVEG